ITISSIFLSLFIFQIKISKHIYYPNPKSTLTKVQKQPIP
ncbi:hypothetical protein DBR06_SOUSAS1310068, partial [Sousa chinensis]